MRITTMIITITVTDAVVGFAIVDAIGRGLFAACWNLWKGTWRRGDLLLSKGGLRLTWLTFSWKDLILYITIKMGLNTTLRIAYHNEFNEVLILTWYNILNLPTLRYPEYPQLFILYQVRWVVHVKVVILLARLIYDVGGRDPTQLHYQLKLLLLIVTGEEGLSCVEFG